MGITIPEISLDLNPLNGLLDGSYDPNQTGYGHSY